MSFVPLHTRVITLRLRWSRPGEVVAEGRLMDLRKRSIVPLGASLRGPGLVHDMATRVHVDVERLSITAVEPAMTAFPYVASQYTGGEACSGRMADVQSLVGTRLTEAYAEEVGALLGGPRGCFHIFTLLRLSGPAVVAALRHDRVRGRLAAEPQPGAGEVLWSRSVSVDAFKGEGLALRLHGTLTDVFQSGGPPEAGGGSERLDEGLEVMADLETAFPQMKLARVEGRRRLLSPGVRNAAPWQAVAEYGALREVGVRKGFTARVQEILGDADGLRPESHLIFMMAPVVMQSVPGLLEELDIRPGGGRSATGTALDSCHMWRAEGPLDRMTRGAGE
jgi:hypothetical protein